MRPEPISRFAPDGLLQTTGEALGYLAIRRLLGSFGNQIEEHFEYPLDVRSNSQ